MARPAPLRIEASECLACGACIAACPPRFAAIRRNGWDVVLDSSACSGCRKCLGACPVGALRRR